MWNFAATRITGTRERRYGVVAWRLMLMGLLALYLWPVSSGIIRLAAVVLLPVTWAWTLWLFGGQRIVFRIGLVLALLVIGLLVLPGRSVNHEDLRRAFLRELQSYEGVRYVWGGENLIGIDCSGLVRCAFLNARMKQAVRTANGALVRETMVSWWHDASARALQNEYRGETRKLFAAESIQKLDRDRIQPGDFAVTSDGIHVLAYLGDGVWIEADPGINRVIRLNGNDKSQWLTTPVDVMRWRRLE
jgi:hypothetical protein